MKKILILIIVILCVGCNKEDERVINVLNWSSYIPSDVIEDFEKETGIKVNYSTYSSNEELLAKVSSAKEGTYDLIFPSANPVGIVIVYLGFGAGLAIFMFTGFVKSIPLEIEEAAMIDGCTPIQTYFQVVFPIMKPTAITVAILDAMWIWNDYLLPSLVLNVNKYKTVQIAVQNLKQSYGQIDWGAMMAVLVLAIIPIVIFYIFAQKYIIEGVMSGAVKG